MSEIGNNSVGLGKALICNSYLKLSGGFLWSLSFPSPNDEIIQVTNFVVGHVMEMQNALFASSLVKSCLILQGLFKGWKHSESLKETLASSKCCHGRNGLYGTMKIIKKQVFFVWLFVCFCYGILDHTSQQCKSIEDYIFGERKRGSSLEDCREAKFFAQVQLWISLPRSSSWETSP